MTEDELINIGLEGLVKMELSEEAEYQRYLLYVKWRNLPFWKRIFTKNPRTTERDCFVIFQLIRRWYRNIGWHRKQLNFEWDHLYEANYRLRKRVCDLEENVACLENRIEWDEDSAPEGFQKFKPMGE